MKPEFDGPESRTCAGCPRTNTTVPSTHPFLWAAARSFAWLGPPGRSSSGGLAQRAGSLIVHAIEEVRGVTRRDRAPLHADKVVVIVVDARPLREANEFLQASTITKAECCGEVVEFVGEGHAIGFIDRDSCRLESVDGDVPPFVAVDHEVAGRGGWACVRWLSREGDRCCGCSQQRGGCKGQKQATHDGHLKRWRVGFATGSQRAPATMGLGT